MRRDFQIAILGTVSAVPLGVALMAAPEYLHIPPGYLGICFWGGLGITATLLVLAVAIAIRGEASEPQSGHGRRMITLAGMIVCALGFLGFAAAFFWDASSKFRLAIVGIDVVSAPGSSVSSFVINANAQSNFTEITPLDWRLTIQAASGATDEVEAVPITGTITFGLERGKNLQLTQKDFLVSGEHAIYPKGNISGRILFRSNKIAYQDAHDRTTTFQLLVRADNHLFGSSRVSLGEVMPEWEPPSLEELFVMDFQDLPSMERRFQATVHNSVMDGNNQTSIDVRFRLYQDFRSGTDFISVYMPEWHDVKLIDNGFSILTNMRKPILDMRHDIRTSMAMGIAAPGSSYQKSTDLKFSGKVFLYTLNPLTAVQIGDITKLYTQSGMSLEIRGMDYAAARVRDLLIAHHSSPTPPK